MHLQPKQSQPTGKNKLLKDDTSTRYFQIRVRANIKEFGFMIDASKKNCHYLKRNISLHPLLTTVALA